MEVYFGEKIYIHSSIYVFICANIIDNSYHWNLKLNSAHLSWLSSLVLSSSLIIRALFFSLSSMYPPPTLLLVDCSVCLSPLPLPPGARSIRCASCNAVTSIPDTRTAPPPSQSLLYPSLPSPYNHAPTGQPPSPHGRKRAVICGISYKNSRHELKGCINDAKCMQYLLVNKFHFPESSILMLTGTTFNSSFLNWRSAWSEMSWYT